MIRSQIINRLALIAAVLLMVVLVRTTTVGGRAANGPQLSIPSAIPAAPGTQVTVPLNYAANGAEISSLVFSIDYDANWLTLDPADGNGDGLPDDIEVNVPPAFLVSASFDASDTDGEIDFTIFDASTPLATMPDGQLITITFTARQAAAQTVAAVNFSDDPPPSFGNTSGQSTPGTGINGSVVIGQGPMTHTPTPTSTSELAPAFLPAVVYGFTPTPSPTLTPSPTATITPSPTPTATATATSKPPDPPPPPPPTSQPPPTNTPTPNCTERIVNGGFENNSGWQININEYPAAYSSAVVHAGSWAMRTGIVNPADNRYSYSSIQQAVTIPDSAGNVTLRFWLHPLTTGSAAARLDPPPIIPTSSESDIQLSDDAQMVLLYNHAGQHTLLFQRQNTGWSYHEINLTAYRGQTVTLYFGVYNNGWGGITAMYVDDVSLVSCP